MNDIPALVRRAESFASKQGLAISTVSTAIFNDGKRLGELKSGKSRLWPETYEKALAALIELEIQYRERA